MTSEHQKSKIAEADGQTNIAARTEINTLYTPLDEALMMLRERRDDTKLRGRVTEFHRLCPPTFLRAEPNAFLFRNIITPNYEFECFVSAAKEAGLPPLCMEFTEDFFSSQNLEKRRLCRPVFEVRPKGFVGLRILSPQMTRRRLCDLLVANGKTLPAFHRTLLLKAYPEFDQHRHDISPWFSNSRREGFCYLHYLALFICDGILFENFIVNDPGELRFTRERILPSFARATSLFGVRPLIVPLLPRDTECDERWRCLPGSLREYACELLNSRS